MEEEQARKVYHWTPGERPCVAWIANVQQPYPKPHLPSTCILASARWTFEDLSLQLPPPMSNIAFEANFLISILREGRLSWTMSC
jgi:hypothetical protein